MSAHEAQIERILSTIRVERTSWVRRRAWTRCLAVSAAVGAVALVPIYASLVHVWPARAAASLPPRPADAAALSGGPVSDDSLMQLVMSDAATGSLKEVR